MRYTFVLLALAASAAAQAVTGIVVPSSAPPQDCENSRQGSFQITVANVSTPNPSPVRRSFDLAPRQGGTLSITLNGGVLTDQGGHTGYIASNYQFQFDKPPQAGAIYTGGFSICANGSLALGGSAIFWQCLSGTFYNLYDRDWAAQCNAVYILALGGDAAVFSTTPPGPVSTGPSEATIKNGGGTQSLNSTSTGIVATRTASGPATTSRPTSASTSASTGGAASITAGSGSSSGSGGSDTATSSSKGAAVAMATDAPQALLSWAVGIAGALALV